MKSGVKAYILFLLMMGRPAHDRDDWRRGGAKYTYTMDITVKFERDSQSHLESESGGRAS